MGLNEGNVTFSLASTYIRLPRGIVKSAEITTCLPEKKNTMKSHYELCLIYLTTQSQYPGTKQKQFHGVALSGFIHHNKIRPVQYEFQHTVPNISSWYHKHHFKLQASGSAKH
jgi:hypothetical protein